MSSGRSSGSCSGRPSSCSTCSASSRPGPSTRLTPRPSCACCSRARPSRARSRVGEQEMLYKVFDFADKEVADVMVPRPEVVALSVDLPPGEALQEVLDSPYTRYPVYRGSLDEIVGILHVRDLVRGDARPRRRPARPRRPGPARDDGAGDQGPRRPPHGVPADEPAHGDRDRRVRRGRGDRHARGSASRRSSARSRTSSTSRTRRSSASTTTRSGSTARSRSTTSTRSSAPTCRPRTTTRSPASCSAGWAAPPSRATR